MDLNFQRHPYINIRFGFPSSPYLSTIFFRLSTNILTFLEAVEPTLQRHPTLTSDSDSSPRLTYPTIFFRLSTAILTFLKAVEPYFQRHHYINIRFWFHSSPYLPQLFFTPLYHHFNFSWSGGVQPPTSPLHQQQIHIPLLPLPTSTFFPPLYHHFNISWSGGAQPPTSPLHQHQIPIPLLK